MLCANFYLKIRSEILFSIKSQGVKKFSNTDFSYIRKFEKGHVSNVLNEQSNRAILAVTNFVKTTVFFLNFLIYAIFFIYVDSILGVLSFILGATVFVTFTILNKKLKKSSKNLSKKSMDIEVVFFNLEHGFKYFLASGYLHYVKRYAIASIEKFKDLYFRTTFYSSLAGATKDFIMLSILVIIFAVHFSITGALGEVVLLSILLMYRVFSVLFGVLISFQNLLVQYGSINVVHELFRKLELHRRKHPVAAETGVAQYSKFTPELKLLNVHYQYDESSSPAINNVSIDIESGKITALIGKSGSGKSTVVDILLGELNPCSGQILYNGKPLSNEKKPNSLVIGYVPQTPILVGKTLKENIILDSEFDEKRYLELVDSCKLKSIRSREELNFSKSENIPQTYSGGELQRIALARELYKRPNFLVLDEPTSALDPGSTATIKKVLESLSGRTTIFMVAHDYSLLDIATRIYVFDRGRVAAEGPLELVKNTLAGNKI